MTDPHGTAGWDHPTVLDAFERDGEWWVPGDPAEARVPGRLSFDPAQGARLKTQRPFREAAAFGPGEGHRPPVILGFGELTRPYTLCQTTRYGRVRPPGDREGASYYARYLVDGVHLREPRGAAFASLLVGFTDLEEWAGHRPFAGPGLPIDQRNISYREMEPVEAEVGAIGARVTVMSHIPGWGEASLRTMRWEHRVVFEVEPERACSLDWYRGVLDGIQDLLTLLIGRPVYPTGVEARTPGRDRHDARLYFDGGPRAPEARVSGPVGGFSRGDEPLLPLGSVRASFPRALGLWFDKRGRLGPVHDLFFGALFGPRTGPNFEFLTLAQALESFHRRTEPDAIYLPEGKYLEDLYPLMKENLPSAVSGDLRQRIKDMLRYGYQWSLRKRMKHLMEGVPEEGVVGHGVGYFTGPVVLTRNHLTHHPDEPEPGVLRGTDLMVAVDELRRLLAFLLLRETGLEEETIVAALADVPRYGYSPLD